MLLFIIIFSFLFPFLYKYSFVVTNQFSQIPIILYYLKPNYLENDWYVQASSIFNARTFFSLYITQTAKIIPLYLSFFLHYILFIFLVAIATYKLSLSIFKNTFVSLATTISILFGQSITIGGNILITRDFSAPQLPLALTLFGASLLIRKNFTACAFIFILSAYLHPLLGIEAPIIFFTTSLIAFRQSKKTVINLFKKAIFPYILFSLPVFFLYINKVTTDNISTITKINILAFMRNPHHFLATKFPINQFIQFAWLLLLLILFSFILRNKIPAIYKRFISTTILIVLVLSLAGFLFTEIYPFYPFVISQPFRLTLYIYWLSAIVIFGGSFYLANKYPGKYNLLLFFPLLLYNIPSMIPFGKVNSFALLLAVLLIVFYKYIPKYTFVITMIIYFSLTRFHYKLNISSFILYPEEKTSLAGWVNQNTDPSALFLIPPDFESFRLISNRAIIADWKSVPLNNIGLIEWADRMCELGNIDQCDYKNISKEKVVSGYKKHTEESLLRLKKKYHYRYFITDQQLQFITRIYDSGRYYIYDAARL